MALSEEEKRKAYQEQVARAEVMKEEASRLNKADKAAWRAKGGLFQAPPGIGTLFDKSRWKQFDGDVPEDDGLRGALEQAARGWSAAVDKQRAANFGEVTPEAAVPSPAADEGGAARIDEDGEARTDEDGEARIAALEAEIRALKISALESKIEALRTEVESDD